MNVLRPSAAPSWSVCPGYVRMQRPEFDNVGDTTVREEGTACHFAAQMLHTGQDLPEVAPNGVEIDDDMVAAAQDYLVHCFDSMGEHLQVEQPVQCHGIHERCEGTTDACAFLPHSYEIWAADLKYGFRAVDPDTPQLVCYADGVARKYNVDLQRAWVNLAIFQPRAWHPDGPWRVRRVHGTQLLQEIAQLSRKAHSTDDPNAPCIVNDKCGDCTGRFQCEALRNASLQAIERVGRPLPVDMPLPAREAELRYVEHAAKMLDAYVSGLRMVVEHALRGGARGSHYQIKQSAPGRLKWNEGMETRVKALAAIIGVDALKPQELRTPTQLKKELGESVVELYASRTPGATQLAPININRYAKLLGKY